MPEVDGLLADVVEQAAGRRDQDVDAAAQRIDLGVDADAAVDERRLEAEVLPVGPDAFLDLRRELARRRQDERANRMAGGRG